MIDLRRLGRAAEQINDQRIIRFDSPRCENCSCGMRFHPNAADTDLSWSAHSASPAPPEGEPVLLSISARGFHETIGVVFGIPLLGLFLLLLVGSKTAPEMVVGASFVAVLLWWRLLSRISVRLHKRLAVRLESPLGNAQIDPQDRCRVSSSAGYDD